jgi:hypothetical protein
MVLEENLASLPIHSIMAAKEITAEQAGGTCIQTRRRLLSPTTGFRHYSGPVVLWPDWRVLHLFAWLSAVLGMSGHFELRFFSIQIFW